MIIPTSKITGKSVVKYKNVEHLDDKKIIYIKQTNIIIYSYYEWNHRRLQKYGASI